MLLALKSARLYFFCMPSVEEKHCLGNLLNGIWWGDLSTICSLGSIPADEGSISAVQLLVVHFNDHTNSAEEVNEAVKQLFTWKGRAMVTFIPPTQAALQNKRAVGWSCLFISAAFSYTLISSNCTNINLLYKLHIKSTCTCTLLIRIDI